MKLIDEKGKLFGKVNIIDLFIVLFVIGALFAVNYKLGLIKKIDTIEQSTKTHIVKFWIKDVAGYTVTAINKGDLIKEQRSDSPIGNIITKEVIPSKQVTTDINGQWVLSEVPERFDVLITAEVPSVGALEDLKLGSIAAKVGSTITLTGPRFQVNSYIAEVE